MKTFITLLSWVCFIVLAMAAPMANAHDVIHLQEKSEGIAATQATIEGHSGLFLFDSGMGTSGITPEVARQVGCRPWGKVTGFRAIGERVDLPRCNATHVSIGTFSLTLPQIVVIDLERFMGPAGRKFSGVLGLDIFAGQTITLNVADNQIILENSASLAGIKHSGIEVPIRLVRAAEGAAFTADLGVLTSQGLLWMEIDTGNYGPSLIDKEAAPLLGLDQNRTTRQELHLALNDGLNSLGPAVVRDLILDGDLGRDILRHWLITLDLATGHGWIRPLGK